MTVAHLERLRDYQRRFAETLGEVSPELPIPTCGEWTARDLALHLADIYTWAAHRAGGARVRLEPGQDLVAHYRTAAAVLLTTLSELDPNQACWTLLDDDRPADEPRIGTRAFWHRRQALETMVHLWDLRTAAGLATAFTPAEWWDCADEVVTVMQPRQVRLARIAPPSTRVVVVPSDAEGLVLDGAPPSAPVVRVSGTAEDLALLLWGRRSAELLAVDGDRAALADALRGAVP
ncbi:MAG: maleylpyruvate isomerase family mycothiol-dependent enzyme [Propionibacteriales bacterium]|nr:maleylpyruvate isomerase family mycothiol-dependent enzyme [Propionibacteriales bacterium]